MTDSRFDKAQKWFPLAVLGLFSVSLVATRCGGPESGSTTSEPNPTVVTVTQSVVAGQNNGQDNANAGSPGDNSAALPAQNDQAAPGNAAGQTNATGPAADEIDTCTLADLPSQAAVTVRLIRSGGPFPYPRTDGTTFYNNERRLNVQEKRTYYREYTVPTPGENDRGERRIVTGGNPAASPPEWYYTGDHYESFCRLSLS